MKLAIMQPYLFPYIGYFQLINGVDKFVLLDDVNYINRGWINRNRILVNGSEHLFTIPVKKASQNKLINECELTDETWQPKFLKTIELSYKKSPFFNEVYRLIEDIIFIQEKNLSIFIAEHFKKIHSYLELQPLFFNSSSYTKKNDFKGQDRIIEICKAEGATHYINPIGGTELYENAKFSKESIELRFLKTNKIVYPQFSNSFIPYLSIIDVLMFNSKQAVINLFEQYTLFSNE